jgi:hypothetical protein
MLMIPLTVFGEGAVKNNASEISKRYAASWLSFKSKGLIIFPAIQQA